MVLSYKATHAPRPDGDISKQRWMLRRPSEILTTQILSHKRPNCESWDDPAPFYQGSSRSICLETPFTASSDPSRSVSLRHCLSPCHGHVGRRQSSSHYQTSFIISQTFEEELVGRTRRALRWSFNTEVVKRSSRSILFHSH